MSARKPCNEREIRSGKPGISVSFGSEDEIIRCTSCGTFLGPYDIRIHDGKDYCDKCYDSAQDASAKLLREKFEKAGYLQPKSCEPAAPEEDGTALKDDDYREIAETFKCLGDPCRVKIIEMLGRKELCVFEFIEAIGYQYSTVSYHLQTLKELGLAYSYRRGNFQVYVLTNKGDFACQIINKSRDLVLKGKPDMSGSPSPDKYVE
jgi:ArsR family transcriptional regulator